MKKFQLSKFDLILSTEKKTENVLSRMREKCIWLTVSWIKVGQRNKESRADKRQKLPPSWFLLTVE